MRQLHATFGEVIADLVGRQSLGVQRADTPQFLLLLGHRHEAAEVFAPRLLGPLGGPNAFADAVALNSAKAGGGIARRLLNSSDRLRICIVPLWRNGAFVSTLKDVYAAGPNM
jgi:hypothetical protein